MLTPSRCGRMDQCVVMGPGAVGLMEFDNTQCTLRKLHLPATFPTAAPADATLPIALHDPARVAAERNGFIQNPALYFVVVDLKSTKDTVVILRELNECFPFPANETQVSLSSLVFIQAYLIIHCFKLFFIFSLLVSRR